MKISDVHVTPDMELEAVLLIVMEVSGCGKYTLASALALHMCYDLVDGDDLHLPASIAQLRSGVASCDADTWPQLDRVGDYLNSKNTFSLGRVVACSALKKTYRDCIRKRAGEVFFLSLDGEFDVVQKCINQRLGHYM